MSTNRKKILTTRLVAALLGAGVIGSTGAALLHQEPARAGMAPVKVAYDNDAATGALTAAPGPVNAAPVAPPDFAKITQQYGPAVVNITVTGNTKVANNDSGSRSFGPRGTDPFGDDPFFEFFRRFQQPGPRGGLPGQPHGMPTRGQGSGFIVDANGIILTNAHVVRDAKEVTVKLTDRREFIAKVLGADPKTDVAVLKIDAKDLPVVALGKPSELRVGEWVLAIGAPFGFENSVTAGVVSAKGRNLPDDSAVPFIQTDVAVNPGNSGGPLFNGRGEVVGINSQIYSRTGGYQGLSFAIPIDLASKIERQIVEHGEVKHARLGVTIQEVNQTLASSFKLDKAAGALVASVQKGSAADKAGLQPGDVIRSVNGRPIIASGELSAMVALKSPGDKLQLDVWRNGQPETIAATLQGMDKDTVQTADAATGDADSNAKLGLSLRPLQPQERAQAGNASGLLVEDVDGPAALAGVAAGDLLLAVNGTPVKSVEQARAALSRSGDKSVALLIQRGENKIFVPVRIG